MTGQLKRGLVPAHSPISAPPAGGRGWRNLCFALGALCAIQAWRDCHRPAEPATHAQPEPPATRRSLADREAASATGDSLAPGSATATEPAGFRFHGFLVPTWATWFAPRPGEALRDYRDRVVPFARQAIAPQRARVAQRRDSFAIAANLRPQQLADLDRTTQDTASALEERVLGAVMNGDVDPSTFKPMAGVTLARDMIDIVDRGNTHFLDSLDASQKTALARDPFDFADYLVFSTRWEDAVGAL